MCVNFRKVYASRQTQQCIHVHDTLAQFQLIPYDLHAQFKIAP